MSLLVYKFSDYRTIHEREQYRVLCNHLKDYYESAAELCIFLANYNIGSTELDGLIIKRDAFICIEFKKHGGDIVATENGDWKANGSVIKGGSGKTVYQQANLNHIFTRKGLKLGTTLTNKQLKDIPVLIVFHNPITSLENTLGGVTQCWLHITDDNHFIEKVQDITTPHLYLEDKDLQRLLLQLNLSDEYLDTQYCTVASSNSFFESYNENTIGNRTIEIAENVNEQNENRSQQPSGIDSDTQEEIDNISNYIKQIFSQLYKNESYSLHIYRYNDPNLRATLPDIVPKKQWYLLIQIADAATKVDKLQKFMHRTIFCVKDYLSFEIGMPVAEYEHIDTKESTEISLPIDAETPQQTTKIETLKSHTKLPAWLDWMIFQQIKAQYNPDYKKHSYNLDLTEDEVLNYLGTYFPRSYSEAFCIYDNIFHNSQFIDATKNKQEINILDIGCGTGGEIIGLIYALEKYLPSNIQFNIEAIDGNQYSLNIFRQIIELLTKRTHRQYNINAKQTVFQSVDDIHSIATSYQDKTFDFIQMCKFGCELESRKVCKMANPYKLLLMSFAGHLAPTGLFLMLDVTTQSHTDNLFYPILLNTGIREALYKLPHWGTLIPTCCGQFDKQCDKQCFTQHQFSIDHSQKMGDQSRVAYRVLAQKDFIESLNVDKTQYKYLIKSMAANDNICDYSPTEAPKQDAFYLK